MAKIRGQGAFEGKVEIGPGGDLAGAKAREEGGGATVPYKEPCSEDGIGVAWVASWGARGGTLEIRAGGGEVGGRTT